MDPAPVLSVLTARGCRFVVVGSAAQKLIGEEVLPADLDVVVDASISGRRSIVDAATDLDAYLVDDHRLRTITPKTPLPWDWSWTMLTPYGPVDMIVRFIDGAGYEDFDRDATTVVLADGSSVRCRSTRHVE